MIKITFKETGLNTGRMLELTWEMAALYIEQVTGVKIVGITATVKGLKCKIDAVHS